MGGWQLKNHSSFMEIVVNAYVLVERKLTQLNCDLKSMVAGNGYIVKSIRLAIQFLDIGQLPKKCEFAL